MDFVAGPYEPLPLSDDRSETPPPEFDPQPFTGIELIVSGLPLGSLTTAADHLNAVVEDLRRKGAEIPLLQISSPATIQPLDFVYVSLSGPLRESPRLDLLAKVMRDLQTVEGLCINWKAAPGRVDKSRQAYFQVDDNLNPADIKARIDRILQQNDHPVQGSYIPGTSHRIIYHFLKASSIITLTDHPIILDNRSYYPRRPRYVQPSHGLEIAVAGVGEFTGVRAVIDHYIERTFATNDSNEPIVRRSRLALDDTVYCAVLRTPAITQRVLAAGDDFKPFGSSRINHDKPQYVYTLNTTSIPLFFNARTLGSFSHQSDPTLERRLDRVNAQSEATAASLKEVVSDVKQLAYGFQEAQTTITRAFTDSTAIYSANSELTAAQFDVSSLMQSISTNNILLGIAPPDRQEHIRNELESLKEQLNEARAIKTARAAEVKALRASQTAALLPQRPISLLSANVPDSAPSSRHKRLRMEMEDTSEENQVQEMMTSMEVDLQVRSILSSLSDFFETFSLLLDESAARVDLLLKGLYGHNQSHFPKTPAPASIFIPKKSPSTYSPFSFLSVLFILVICISIFSPTVRAFPSSGPVPVTSSLRTLSINANGLYNPMKLNAIQDMVKDTQPHIVVIGETKSANEVGSRLKLPGYDSYENPGRQSGRKTGKWGVIVAVRRGVLTVQRLLTADPLRGRAVALDLTIPTTNNVAFPHRFIGVYAPWNPGGTDDEEHLFWPEITRLCSDAKYSWSLSGDFNATLSHFESTSTNFSISPARLQYSQFLQLTDAVDVWHSQPNTIASSSFYTCRSQLTALSEPTFSIIDRVAALRAGTLTAEIALSPHFIPCTDHRPVFSRIVLSPPSSIPGVSDIPSEVPATDYAPRFYVPFRHEKYRYHLFSATVDERLNSGADVFSADITSDDDFEQQYSALTDALLSSAKTSFRSPIRSSQSRKITNPTINLILTEIRHINRILSALSCNALPQFPATPWVNGYILAFLSQRPTISVSSSLFHHHFRTFLTSIRRNLHKIRFAEERIERQHQINKTAKKQIRTTLAGGSCKRLYPHSFSSLPLAITPSPDLEPDFVVTGADSVENATIAYFQNLYHRTDRAPQQKPWLTSPSVSQIRADTSSDPFQWPVLLSITDLRALLSRGNSRPTPGPDGWEKWFLKHLSDHALSVILKLLNHIISRSHFPACLKPTNLSTIHKRGPSTYLSNYRGVACNNCLQNLPFAWLNYLLPPYLTRHHIIPECQVATQPGTQGRDLISYISQIELWAAREHVPLYVLQRDQ